MVFAPKKTAGFVLGVLLAFYFFGIIIGGVHYSLGENGGVLKWMILIPVYGFIPVYCYLLAGLVNMKYNLDEEKMVLTWATKKYTIDWQVVTGIIKPLGRVNTINYFGISWPGYMVGVYQLRGIGLSKIFVSELRNILVIETRQGNFTINADEKLEKYIEKRSGVAIAEKEMVDLPESEVGISPNEDILYMCLFVLNIICLVALPLYFFLFMPGYAGPRLIAIFIPLANALFLFNMFNASRLYTYAKAGSYMIWFMGLTINIVLLVMSIVKIGFSA